MHTERTHERRGITALLGLAVAGATLMAGMVVQPVSQASAAYDPAKDGFRTELDPTLVPELTVTKYLSTKPGTNPTGGSEDGNLLVSKGNSPASDVIFNVYQVTPATGKTFADINPLDESTYIKGTSFAGQTDTNGVISKWFEPNSDGTPSATAKAFPTGVNYFVMQERQDISPSFMPGGLYYGKGYSRAQDSFFSLPYRTQTGDKGYLYHLHLFPKNVNDSDLTKQVTTMVDGSGRKSVIAKPGDVISYRLGQRIYNEGTAVAGDNKLDVSELSTPPADDLIVSDRMSSALEMLDTSIVVQLEDGDDTRNMALVKGTDYSLDSTTTSPVGFDGQPLFATETGNGTKYWNFKFFPDQTKVKSFAAGSAARQFNVVITFQAKVTANGDSTAASQGTIQNNVISTNTDKGSGVNPGGRTDTPAATASFGKVDKEGKGLPGAVFRLVDESDDSKYLASDGKTYTESALPPGATFYQATSNNQGAVVFTALPIMDPDATSPDVALGRAGNWRIEEVKAPDGFSRPMVLFSKVSFAATAGQPDYVVGKTANQIVQHFTNAPIEANHSYLSFERYNFSGTPAPPITVGGHAVDDYMANYKNGDGPVTLPLTGGRGIVLLLVIGLIVMGGALYARNRRNASRA